MKGWVLLLAAAVIGVANAVVFKVFEEIVNKGTELIWNDWLQTDSQRWLVVPVAIVLSVLFSLLLKQLRESRWIEPEINLHLGIEGNRKATLMRVGSILAVGASGLLAGASLGPEMPLSESSLALGDWARTRLRLDDISGKLLVAASLGALFVAFLGSILLVLLPLIIVYQRAKKLSLLAISTILLAGITSYGTLWLLNHHPHGYGTIPANPPAHFQDYWGAVVVALCISATALLLVRTIKWLGAYTHRFDRHFPWYIAAACFGLVLGGLYLIGGQVVQFSGSQGISLLLGNSASYGAWAFLGLAAVKLLATAWSKTTGYRGGLFFPSIFVGVAISLWLGSLFGSLAGPGAMIGAIAAIFMALSIPDRPDIKRQDYISSATIAFLFMAALLPATLIPLALLAIITAGISNRLLVRLSA